MEPSVFPPSMLAILVAWQLSYLPQTLAFTWRSCSVDSANETIQVKELKITPDVISLDGSITISAQVEVKQDLNGPLEVRTDLHKTAGLLQGQSIPCQGRFGSCTFTDICTEFENVCPIAAMTYTVNKVIKIPHMSSFVRWMAEGAYEGKITVTDSTGNQLACIAVTLEVAQ
ncbi:hypothetical protein RvY_05790-1 [Ramazzottius varieornatus]|uniref:MD-2-related lipid-recognition domain-containing protein n=1 Tax=Ramazzottius varieornatus TaxID=947166 RepID=A0A1D1V1V1_RAMVA|nr:hypothetical protein RvY_05790-1 [Ramazzottius varieornatus]